MTPGRNWTQAILVGGERCLHCVISASLQCTHLSNLLWWSKLSLALARSSLRTWLRWKEDICKNKHSTLNYCSFRNLCGNGREMTDRSRILTFPAQLWSKLDRVLQALVYTNILKPRSNRSHYANATYRNIVGRNMLCAFGHRVATSCDVFGVSNLSQQHPTCRNISQHDGQTHTTCCAQHAAVVWPRSLSTLYEKKLPKDLFLFHMYFFVFLVRAHIQEKPNTSNSY